MTPSLLDDQCAARNGRKAGNLSHAGVWGFTLLLVLGAWLGIAPTARGFALLGPYAPWMTLGVGYDPAWRSPEGDIGGPMALGEEYRWNIPVVTYGFDQSFLDYFGQGGVDAVEQAIQILNDLPPASSTVLTNHPLASKRTNYRALSQYCYDLKSFTLSLLLEQMGLAQPTRYCFVLRRWEPSRAEEGSGFDEVYWYLHPWITNCVENRNYDPSNPQPSHYVNATFYTWRIGWTELPTEPFIRPLATNPYTAQSLPVSERSLGDGEFFSRLTQDDAGGLLYLYSRTNINVENLDDSIGPLDSGEALVRLAPRPGIEKITFLRHPTTQTGGFATLTNQFADTYFTNSQLATQLVQRVVVQPDFLFSAEETYRLFEDATYGLYLALPWSRRTDTSPWQNGSMLNGNPDGDGPGVIRPPVKIALGTHDRFFAAAGGLNNTNNHIPRWASIGVGTNVMVFPGSQANLTNLTSLTLRTRLVNTNGANVLEWTLFGRYGATYRMEASADLAHWTTNSVLTNTPDIFQFTQPATGPNQFFRVIQEN